MSAFTDFIAGLFGWKPKPTTPNELTLWGRESGSFLLWGIEGGSLLLWGDG